MLQEALLRATWHSITLGFVPQSGGALGREALPDAVVVRFKGQAPLEGEVERSGKAPFPDGNGVGLHGGRHNAFSGRLIEKVHFWCAR